MVLNHPIHTADDAEHAAATGAGQHTNGHDGDRLGNTVELATHGARDMCAVTLTVFGTATVVDLGVTCSDATTKVSVVTTNTSVKNVCIDSRAGVVVRVILIQRNSALVNTVQTP